VNADDGAPAGAPRTRAEQRAERRKAIIDAALRIIASRGLPAVTHRTVAREARVPLAATTYYFASKNEILSEALESLAAVEVARLERLAADVAEGSPTETELAAALGEALIPVAGDAERTWLAQFEIYVEAARNPDLRPAVARGFRRARRLLAAGDRRPRARAPGPDRGGGDQRHPPRPPPGRRRRPRGDDGRAPARPVRALARALTRAV
jgi:DNA-binding transcriptional regulator YbjK